MSITQSYTIKIPYALLPSTTPIPSCPSRKCPAHAHHSDRVCGVQNLQRKERAMAEGTPHTTFNLH